MPLGKYYCDYCDKEFQDTAAARRRHLQGAQHHRARALWYDSVRRQESHGGASPLLQPDGAILGQGVCNHFVRTARTLSLLSSYYHLVLGNMQVWGCVQVLPSEATCCEPSICSVWACSRSNGATV
ncbi:zinc finger CCCH domain-containing protein 3 isoform X2 [Triticum aestivum]|uniref:zinc finger CCCH domain-containing protein 3 isoform X2 n=1 Tax=Triticum aestivum TaxID=4565 RepID=UPI001D017F0E|nr:zinc finger CCCH domain-containing protein 3-like isoform X2 [Triticum aestivum]